MKISGNTFLVTGGSSGLGLACVTSLIIKGANVIIADVTHPPEIFSDRNKCIFVHTDITDPESVQTVVDKAFQQFHGLHGIINCAGIGTVVKTVSKKKFGALDPFKKIIEINLTGTFNVLSIGSVAMSGQEPDEAGERGIIINTSSVAAYDGKIGQAAYSASKGGVASMTLPLAREMAQYGIRVMAIAPGAFETPMLARLPRKPTELLIKSVPYPKRLGLPDEFASLVEHIIENRYLNGEVIRIDGAIRMS